MVLELKPPVDRDKGMVINEIVRDAEGAWYFGDDVSDIKAFAALRARAAADPDFFGVCVAVANPETGHEVAEGRRPDPGLPRPASATSSPPPPTTSPDALGPAAGEAGRSGAVAALAVA